MRAARAQGAALIAAHPYRLDGGGAVDAADGGVRDAIPSGWAPLVDRFELFNRETLFAWVADGRPAGGRDAATSTCLEHLGDWKTLLPCAKDAEAVVRLSPLAAAGVPRAPPVAGRAAAARRLSGCGDGGDDPGSSS